jgi:hypothetical protein
VIGDPGEHIGKPGLRINAIELGRVNERQHDRGALAAAIGAGGQPGLPAKRNLAVILPISGKKCSPLSLASTHGQRVRRIQSEQRASGELVHVELTPGAVTILPAWKLDAIYCAGLTSAPRRFPWRRSAHCTSCSTPANQGWSPRTATSSRRRRRMEGQLPLARRTELACRHTALSVRLESCRII